MIHCSSFLFAYPIFSFQISNWSAVTVRFVRFTRSPWKRRPSPTPARGRARAVWAARGAGSRAKGSRGEISTFISRTVALDVACGWQGGLVRRSPTQRWHGRDCAACWALRIPQKRFLESTLLGQSRLLRRARWRCRRNYDVYFIIKAKTCMCQGSVKCGWPRFVYKGRWSMPVV